MAPINSTITIRSARADDTAVLHTLAALDSYRGDIAGPSLVAQVDGEIVAAVGVEYDWRIANPFVPTADALELLALRAGRTKSEHAARGRRPRWRLAHARAA